jgi:hypothetical protein
MRVQTLLTERKQSLAGKLSGYQIEHFIEKYFNKAIEQLSK